MNHFKLICPECKNEVDLTQYDSLKVGDVIECNHCGITLQVTAIAGDGEVSVEIVEEGK